MAAVAGAGIDDSVTVDGPKFADFRRRCAQLSGVDRSRRTARRRERETALRILRPVAFKTADASAAPAPAPGTELDFGDRVRVAGHRQKIELVFSNDRFRTQIAPARTFGFMHELDALNKMGLARGASLENTLAIEGDAVVNAKLMRFPDEFVRHKILDALGDMALAGAPIIGRFEGRRSGHALNNALLRAVFADAANYDITPAP